MKNFSNNVIFMDTEFSSLDPAKGEILAIALVKMDGSEFYIELDYNKEEIDPWVKKNVVPYFKGEKVSKKEAVNLIKEFVGENKPYAINYVDQFDIPYFYKLIPQKLSPFHWIPIDFAALLFANGLDPEIMSKNRTELYDRLGVDHKKYRRHNALDDAKLLREVYLKLFNIE